MDERVTYLRDVAEAAREAAKTAAGHRKAWQDWHAHGSARISTGRGTGGPPPPEVPEPTDETEDVLLRLAVAIERRIHEIVDPRVPGTGGDVEITKTTATPGVGGTAGAPAVLEPTPPGTVHVGDGLTISASRDNTGSSGRVELSGVHDWGVWHTFGQPWRECRRCGATQCLAVSETAVSNFDAGVWIHPEEPSTCA